MKVATLTLAIAAMAAAQSFQVSGAVVDAVSGARMKRVRVALTPWGGGREVGIITGEDGAFSFVVPKGKYSITAEYRSWREPFGLNGPTAGFGVAIFAGPDQDTSHLTFRWFMPGAITGKILDDLGDPAVGALVQLIRSSVVAGRRKQMHQAWAYANDLGEFRFGPLNGGTYYVAVTGQPWYVARNRVVATVDGVSPNLELPNEPWPAYAPAYYPNAIDLRSAAPLTLAPGAEARADFTLRTINGVAVEVRCPNLEGRPGMLSLMSDGVEGVQGFQRQVAMRGDRQTIFSVPPGRYIVRIAGVGEKPFESRKTIDVGSSAVSVELPVLAATTVRGVASFKNPGTKPRGNIYVRLIDNASNSAMAQLLDGKGAFFFRQVPAGKRRVEVSGIDGFFVSQIGVDGASIKNGLLEVDDGASIQLSLEISDETGRLQGFAMNGERTAPGVLVVLAPVASEGSAAVPLGFQTDSDGSFDFTNMRAGDYVMFALPNLDFEYANPEAARPFLEKGKRVQIKPYATVKDNIALSTLAQ